MVIVSTLSPVKEKPPEVVPIEPERLEKVEDRQAEPTKTIPPLSVYNKINGKPYSVDFFDIKEWDLINGDMPDFEDKIKKVNLIEDYIGDEIDEYNLEDSVESYQNLIDKYIKILDIKPTEKSESKLERVYLYLELMAKQKKLDKRRREILDGI